MNKGHSYQEYRTWYFIMGAGGLVFLAGFIILVFMRAYIVDYSNHDLFLVFGVCFMVPGVVVVAVSAVRLCQFYHTDNSRLGGINTSLSTQPLQPPSPEHHSRTTQQQHQQHYSQQQQQMEREIQQQQYQQKYLPRRQQQQPQPQQQQGQPVRYHQQAGMYQPQPQQQHQHQHQQAYQQNPVYQQQPAYRQQQHHHQQQQRVYQPSQYQQQRPSMPLPRPPEEAQHCRPGYTNQPGTNRETQLRY